MSRKTTSMRIQQFNIRRYFFFDIDGTLAVGNPGRYIPKSAKDAIEKLGAKGIVEIDNELKIIMGPNSKQLKKYIKDLK